MNKKQKIAGRLKALFPKANLSQKRIDAIAAKLEPKVADDADETAIDDVINQANDFMDFEAIAKEDDRIRTLEANQKKAGEEEPNPPGTSPTPPTDDEPEWAKRLSQRLENIEKGEITKTKASTVADLFSKSQILKGLPENQKQSWINRVNLDAEDLASEISSLESEYTELKQSIVDSTSYAGAPFRATEGSDSVSDADLDAVMGNL
jgi:hypothetical protein